MPRRSIICVLVYVLLFGLALWDASRTVSGDPAPVILSAVSLE